MTQPANTEPQDFLVWLASQADGRTVAELMVSGREAILFWD